MLRRFWRAKLKQNHEDLDVKIGTKEEALWTVVKKEAEELIRNHENSLIVQKALLKLAQEMIVTEQSKK